MDGRNCLVKKHQVIYCLTLQPEIAHIVLKRYLLFNLFKGMKRFLLLVVITTLGWTSLKATTPTGSTIESFNLKKVTGNYVSDSYNKRAKGYDWVGVTVNSLDNKTARITVRSRADIKKPTCSFDGEAKVIGRDSLETFYEGKSILFLFKNNKLTIKGRNEEAENILPFFCSGGATMAGTYVKIKGSLDRKQIDKTVYQCSLGYDKLMFLISQKEGKLTIMPIGLTADNSKIVRVLKDSIRSAEISDIDGDNSPEIFIYTSANNGKKVNAIGFSVNNGKSMSDIYLPPLNTDKKVTEGYMGKDEFAMVENCLARRFPIFKKEGNSYKPTGKMRQVQYKLKKGEACKVLTVDKVIEF